VEEEADSDEDDDAIRRIYALDLTVSILSNDGFKSMW